MWKAKVNAHKVVKERVNKCTEQLLIEKPFRCFLNQALIYHGTSTPEHRDHLFYGAVLAEYGPQEIPETIQKEGDDMSLEFTPEHCSREGTLHALKVSQIKHLMAQFQDKVQLYKETGTAESAAICTASGPTHFSDDIDRLNAFYKLLSVANHSDDWGDDILMISGKICKRVLDAAIQCGIRTIISRTGITSTAYDLSVEHNMVAIGFCRGQHFTIYTGRDQILDG